MNLMWIVELSLLLGLAAATRIIFILVESSDFDVHLWFIHFYKKNFRLDNKQVKTALNKGYVGYPPLPHILISRLPKKYWIAAGILGNIGFDLLSVMVIYFSSNWFLGGNEFAQVKPLMSVGGICALIFLTSPTLHPLTARLMAMGGRTLSNLLILCYFIAFAFLFISKLYILIPICIILGILVILSSQFGLQVLTFFSVGLSIYYFDVLPLLVLAACFVTGIITPKLGIKQQLTAKISHYAWYNTAFPGRSTDKRNSFREIWPLFKRMFTTTGKVKAFDHFSNYLVKRFTPFIILYSMPTLLLFVYWLTSGQIQLDQLILNERMNYAFAISTIGFVTFLLVSLKPLAFLGEAERYLEYSTSFFSILFLYSFMSANTTFSLLLLLVVYQVFIILVNFILSLKSNLLAKFMIQPDASFNTLIDFLKSLGPRKYLSIPTKLNAKLSIHLQDQSFFHIYHVFQPDKGLKHTIEDHQVHHFVKPDFNYFIDKYGANILVTHKESLLKSAKMGVSYSLEKLRLMYENNDYAVYELSSNIKQTEAG